MTTTKTSVYTDSYVEYENVCTHQTHIESFNAWTDDCPYPEDAYDDEFAFFDSVARRLDTIAERGDLRVTKIVYLGMVLKWEYVSEEIREDYYRYFYNFYDENMNLVHSIDPEYWVMG